MSSVFLGGSYQKGYRALGSLPLGKDETELAVIVLPRGLLAGFGAVGCIVALITELNPGVRAGPGVSLGLGSLPYRKSLSALA